MNRAHLVVLAALVVGLITTLAAASIYAQDTTPQIVYFRTGIYSVSLSSVQNGTARIPVSWFVRSRPLSADLAFEQYLPEANRYQNVELPRPWNWINSADSGVVKPVPPDDDTNLIRLRLKVIDRYSNELLAEQDLEIEVRPDADVDIDEFAAAQPYASRTELKNNAEVIGVNWHVSNRPFDTNLVFEQVLADGTVRNAELPRNNPYVASEGKGAMALIDVGTADHVTLQVRLIDSRATRTLTSRVLELPVADQDDSPHIVSFTTDTGFVSWFSLAERNGIVPVSWEVANRPDGTNLVFEQVMADGSFRNVELPRSNPWVSSNGVGHMAPVLPGINASEIVLQVRLVRLSNGQTLGTSQIRIPIMYPELATPVPTEVAATEEVSCEFPWFVDIDQIVPCADGPKLTTEAAYQSFQNGFMIWHDDVIWAFYPTADGIVVNDTYEGGEITFDQTPPERLYQPINGFGKAWVENESLRETLGWATSTEASYTIEIQSAQIVDPSNPAGTRIYYTFSTPEQENRMMTARIFENKIETYAVRVRF